MRAKIEFVNIVPVLPSEDIDRDTKWYQENAGFTLVAQNKMYAVIKREHIYIHLQWHANTEDDPLLGGSVIRIFVKNIHPIFNELMENNLVKKNKLRQNTEWGTNEFGFYDLNNNAIFIVEDI